MIFRPLSRLSESDPAKPFRRLRVALVADSLTTIALQNECIVRSITPQNFEAVLQRSRPDLLLVESAWHGAKDAWRYGIASYPDHPERSNADLAKVVARARDLDIPAIFWNREDGVHFDRFIDSARLFDRVLTVDEQMIDSYRRALSPDARVEVMMFAASRHLHYPVKNCTPRRRGSFVGSYSSHVHDGRRAWQERMFAAIEPLGLRVYDRNSDRKNERYRYPDQDWIEVRPAIPYARTARIYRRHILNLNVNTITGSSTAFSRRLVEIMACGTLAVTNPSRAVDEHFAELCHPVADYDEARALFEKVARHGLDEGQQEMARAAAEHVAAHHSWANRIPILLEMTR